MKISKIKYITFLSASILLMNISCSKKEKPEADEPSLDDNTPTDANMFYQLQRVENFGGDTEYDGPVDGARNAIFFSLDTKKGISENYQKSNRWDLSFSDIYNAKIGSNNGKSTSSLGTGSSGIGGIYITEKPFDEVIDIPADSEFKTSVSLDSNGSFGDGIGWAIYDFTGTTIGNGDDNKAHVCYALGNPLNLNNGKTLVRTLIVKTAKGNYAKIKMISLYKNVFAPIDMNRQSESPFFTFEYILVPKGSTKFEINQ